MDSQEILKKLAIETSSKIVLLVIDGLGGLPREETGKTELEEARIPNLTSLLERSICGVVDSIFPGITPGSGPAHLALFGYDPFRYQIGRGILSALGIGFPLEPGDVAIRGNFATVDEEGLITNRRAGRISTERNTELCRLFEEVEIEGVKIFVKPDKEYRIVVILRGEGLSDALSDSDPQREGLFPLEVKPLTPSAEKTSHIVNEFISLAKRKLHHTYPANSILLRGFSKHQILPTFSEVYKLKAAAIATYPMYKGIARLVGMAVLETGEDINSQFKTLQENFKSYDFFYLHIKHPDSAGEDGNFGRKVVLIEEVDKNIPLLVELSPDVIIVTGDHSTPALLRSHSWHPSPILIYSRFCRRDSVVRFSERDCVNGGLGRFPAIHIMGLALANAQKLIKYGA